MKGMKKYYKIFPLKFIPGYAPLIIDYDGTYKSGLVAAQVATDMELKTGVRWRVSFIVRY